MLSMRWLVIPHGWLPHCVAAGVEVSARQHVTTADRHLRGELHCERTREADRRNLIVCHSGPSVQY